MKGKRKRKKKRKKAKIKDEYMIVSYRVLYHLNRKEKRGRKKKKRAMIITASFPDKWQLIGIDDYLFLSSHSPCIQFRKDQKRKRKGGEERRGEEKQGDGAKDDEQGRDKKHFVKKKKRIKKQKQQKQQIMTNHQLNSARLVAHIRISIAPPCPLPP